jgi:RHS repeat-associated protein
MTYDAAGNELKSPAGDPDDGQAAASYSPRNLLQSQFVRQYDRCIEAFGSPCVLPEPVQVWLSNDYDGRGVRVASTDVKLSDVIDMNDPGPQPNLYFYTPELSMLNFVSRSTGRTADVIWFGSRPVADHSATTVRYTFTDHLGTPILQTSSTAAVVWRAEYKPFGNLYQLRAGTSADDQPLRFPGQQVAYSTSAGEENYNIHRWYRSGWGRYTQADPAGIQASPSLYAYADDDPVWSVDPLGLMTFTWIWGPGKPKPSFNPSAMCKSAPTKVACTNFKSVKVTCSCSGCNGVWSPSIVTYVNVDMYIYNGPISPGMVKDKSIVDFHTAVAHEVNKHLNPAAQELEKYFRTWVTDKTSQIDCQNECKSVEASPYERVFKGALEKTKKND